MTPDLHLATLLREAAEAFDLETALLLAQEFGGHEVKLPMSAQPAHPIAQRVGLRVLAWLIDHLGHGRVVIPMGPRHPDRVRAAYRRAEVARRTREGESAAQIASALVLHERSVFLIRQKLREDRQLDLFDSL